jgi:hypothetical protein
MVAQSIFMRWWYCRRVRRPDHPQHGWVPSSPRAPTCGSRFLANLIHEVGPGTFERERTRETCGPDSGMDAGCVRPHRLYRLGCP